MSSPGRSNSKICIYIRHGESEGNVARILSSHKEKYGLTAVGKEGTESAAKELIKLKHVDRIYSSTVLRAKETAAILAKDLKLKVDYSDLLVERDFGTYEGWKFESVKERNRVRLEQIENNYPDFESYEKVARRMSDFSKLLNEGEVTVAVTHLLPIKAALGNVFGRDESWMTGIHIDNSAFTIIDHSKQGIDALLLLSSLFIPKNVVNQIA